MNLCNPNNLSSSELGLFPKEVNDRFGFTLFIMAVVTGVLVLIAFSTISVKKNPRGGKMGHGGGSIGPLVKTYGFWNLFLYAVLIFHFLIYMSGSYKVMGLTYIKDDSLLTLAASVGALISVCGRLVWPLVTEYIEFKYFALI
mmetsp:Transcript_31035/g.5592  ORF Transcript_31035/g.5592 Transcript_31035/m.5592 type:complete len:143 (-) Transcript_31035:390-818(-)